MAAKLTTRRAKAPAPARASGQVQSLTRALAILGAVAESHEGMALTDIAEVVGLAPSTTHRLLTTLEAERFMRFDAQARLWQIGIRAFTVGNAFTRTRDIVAIARPAMRRLMEDSGETVNLYVEEDGEAICMGQVESRQMMRAIARPGGRVKLHCSGAGKAMLAHMRDDELSRILQAHGLPRVTDKTLDTPRRLRADLAAVRERRFAIDDEEHEIGLRCIAAAIVDEHGRPVAAVSLSGPTARLTDDEVAKLGPMVARAAAAISAAYG